jgi:hypothetical protein
MERCDKVPGDLFHQAPGGADAYVLHQVLHDWNDQLASEVLTACRRAIPDAGTLLVIERRTPRRSEDARDWTCADVLMMLLVGGRERCVAELDRLLAATRFARTRVVQTASHLCIVEARPC